MLRIRELEMLHFKLYAERIFSFCKRITCLSGANGSGKTTVLDAIYFLCVTKSYFLHSDALSVKKNMAGMRIKGIFTLKGENTVTCILRENNRKEFYHNEQQYTVMSKHLGIYPCVFITPDDMTLLNEGSDQRRKFIDATLCQLDANYTSNITAYNKILSQRNALLKNAHTSGTQLHELLDAYDVLLAKHGSIIHATRVTYFKELLLHIESLYAELCDSTEHVNATFKTNVTENLYLEEITQHRAVDIASQRTSYGVHRDDIEFKIDDIQFKHGASQGQKKSLIFALKLAQHHLIAKYKLVSPILLLDDIFEKLDDTRSKKLLDFVKQTSSQVFITDTNMLRIKDALGDFEDVEYIQL